MNLSLCCISNTLKEQGLSFKTMTFKSFYKLDKKEALLKLSKIIAHNFNITNSIINFCFNNNIKGYRMSSSLMPLINHPSVNLKLKDLPNYQEIYFALEKIKEIIKETKIRISAHPSEYISLTSDDPRVISNSINDLELHAQLFDLLDLPQSYESPLNIHCRQDGDPETISNKFIRNFKNLSDSVKNRLVLENNDNTKGVWTIQNLHKYFHNTIGTPLTFDVLHHSLLNHNFSEQDSFNLAYNTWNTTPLFHYSEGINGKRNHADTPTKIPNSFNKEVFWDVELKNKDYAIFKIQDMIKKGTN